jgi:hypothetical protein
MATGPPPMSDPTRPVRRRISPRIDRPVPPTWAYRLDLDKALTVGLFKLACDLADRCEHRTHCR